MGGFQPAPGSNWPNGGVPPAYPNSPPGYLDRVWTVHDQGRQFGPHTEPELASLLAAGTVSRAALVWREGSPRWIPITNLVPLGPAVMPATPAAPVVINVSPTPPPRVILPAPGNGIGVASMVLGIIAMVVICFPPISLPLSIIGMIFGVVGITIGKSRRLPTGPSIAGIVLCGFVLLVLTLITAGIVSSFRSAAPVAPPRPMIVH